ncbi:Lysyl-tRNA synthetase [Shigella dysenteriae WRSd3]|uniref:Lysyl-tRNA synthetase n=2 Tax=Shigella dysenteriae TaxID=622 RepID=A0A090NX96_SHIDY|nr:Lysyl-tRNA synthetase [Shigella dysenteriae WRSd3]ESU82188.1 Lysyl-tRNA synthetase [Shigella dysenteriae WRSd5]
MPICLFIYAKLKAGFRGTKMSEQETRGANEAIDFNDELRYRREKLAALRQQGVAFPNDFRRDHTSDQLHEEFDAKDNEVYWQ